MERRKILLSMLQQSQTPISGSALGKQTGVSRQVVVQDVAILRTEGYPILSTTKGYYLDRTEQSGSVRIQNVMVNHRAYGKMTAALNIKSRRDVRVFVDNIRSGKSTPLLNVTSGYHFHTIGADSEAILDEIEEMLRRKGYLAQRLPYEMEL